MRVRVRVFKPCSCRKLLWSAAFHPRDTKAWSETQEGKSQKHRRRGVSGPWLARLVAARTVIGRWVGVVRTPANQEGGRGLTYLWWSSSSTDLRRLLFEEWREKKWLMIIWNINNNLFTDTKGVRLWERSNITYWSLITLFFTPILIADHLRSTLEDKDQCWSTRIRNILFVATF